MTRDSDALTDQTEQLLDDCVDAYAAFLTDGDPATLAAARATERRVRLALDFLAVVDAELVPVCEGWSMLLDCIVEDVREHQGGVR